MAALCGNGLTLYYTVSTFLMTLRKRAFESIVGKGENAGRSTFSKGSPSQVH